MGRIHDTILRFFKGRVTDMGTLFIFHLTIEYMNSAYRSTDEAGRRYQTQPLEVAKHRAHTRYECREKLPPPGRYWAYSKENMERLQAEGRISYSRTGTPCYKIYLDEMQGKALQDIWDDIPPVC